MNFISKSNRRPDPKSKDRHPLTHSIGWPLFQHLADNYNLILLESELNEICLLVMATRRLKPKDLQGFTPKQWREVMASYRANTP